ncbi:AAA domain-containing protein [Stenotrophomonas maltophilia]|uniref:AAA domain-containing protein n=1 Tax=Stenotrophomonas maltophilia TaxID=40324 RepID=UPI0039F72EAD
MIRFCPNCHTERGLHELFCDGAIGSQPCGWDLAGEPIHADGWRPRTVRTQDEVAEAPHDTRVEAHCSNGHALEPGDLLCLQCGAEPAPADAGGAPPVVEDASGGEADAGTGETVIDQWRLLRQISSTDGIRERYHAEHAQSGQVAVLTLYRAGAEPDPAVYDVIRRLPRDHVPDIIATGRWDDRAYEVVEMLTGGSLADLGSVIADGDAVRHVVRELGQALHAFNEAGLRHRDLRPASLLVRARAPLDMVISGFGSARLSEYDLDIVSPLETSRYMAPEAIAGGVAAASDWWSLGMILLEQLTEGRCFEGTHANAYLIHVLANGVPIPADIDPDLQLLLRGLLVRDRHQRWQWPEVSDWLAGIAVAAPPSATLERDEGDGASLRLGERRFQRPALFALQAAQAEHWDEARDSLLRGVIVTWADQAGLPPSMVSALRQVVQHEGVEEDFRLMLALKILNPEMPLIHRGSIVTPGWLLENPLEGYRLISGSVPDLLEQLQTDAWLSRLKLRAQNVRQRALHQQIDLIEEVLRVYLLSTSRARLASQWQERQRLLPDTDHPGLASLAERRRVTEEDLIVLLSAGIGQFRSVEAIVADATALAAKAGVAEWDAAAATLRLQHPRSELYRAMDERILGFARCGMPVIDSWAEQFRLERRMPLARALVVLAVPGSRWQQPQRQQYVAQILDFFEKKVVTAVMRGPLVRMSIGKTTARVDLRELDSTRRPAAALLDHLMQRNARAVAADPEAFERSPAVEQRLRSLLRQSTLYKRDTGIDGLYLGFPFLLSRDPRSTARARIIPLLLWPVRLEMELAQHGLANLAFDGEREEVRINPALESIVGPDAFRRWQTSADELLGRSSLRASDVMDAFGMLARVRSRSLTALPGPDVVVDPVGDELECAAVLFHVTFMGQAIGEDLRQLKVLPPNGTGLETALRLAPPAGDAAAATAPAELQRFFTVASDPSQEAAVLQARQGPGLLIEGPPGTGKSQTIVNMVADAIGRGRSLLIVCQKHAALEVVHKRLVAEGLDQRVVMLNDVNRDREPVIRSIREQLERLFAEGSGDPDGRAARERTAARIEALEGDLDRFQHSLHRIDPLSHLSYRQLLGELIELESGTPPLEFPALRQRLGALDMAQLTALEEQCAPLVRWWLPARYEDSPLADLRPFAADTATLDAFAESLQSFMQAEQQRQQTLAEHPASFEIEDAAPYRTWIDAHVTTLLALRDEQRQRLARWLPLFRSATAGEPVAGDQLIVQLRRVEQHLRGAPHGSALPGLSPALARRDEAALRQHEQDITEVMGRSRWWARLNPRHIVQRGRLNRLLRDHGSATSGVGLPALLGAVRLALHMNPLRHQYNSARLALGLPAMGDDGDADLLPHLQQDITGLLEVQTLARAVAQSPRAQQTDTAMLTADKAQLQVLLDDLDASLLRHAARQASLRPLAVLDDWLDERLAQQLRHNVLRNLDNQLALDRLHGALPSLAAYQQFRGRAGLLDEAACQLLSLLRQREAQLDALPIDQLEGAVRRLLNREARLGWKHRIEHALPELQFSQDEARAKITALAEADRQMRRLNRELLGSHLDTAALGTRKQWEDVTRLTGRRSRRLREFIELGSALGLMHLRPVWLMNPDVASRVLPLQAGLFDTVIYDEASQMPVEYALPTLFRGKVTIVSGDEKQMPPTAFFSSRVESDEAEMFDGDEPDAEADDAQREAFEDDWNRREIKDCPDLLQLARTVLPSTTLQIHYRSAYRELISFSNASFYGNRLNVPVRHPLARIQQIKPLQLIQVDGLYQNQTNALEAERVVAYLQDLWQAPPAQRPSVGVVTFNRKQAELIEDQMEQRASEDEPFRLALQQERERIVQGEDMSVFIKNVENVQGDERDVIVFSTTFGRNGQGTFRRNFGVLGQTGGERRLNVAVTRARQKVVMITSMPINDVSDLFATQRAPASPRDYLQGYLAYARALCAGEFEAGTRLLGRLQTDRSHVPTAARGAQDGFVAIVGDYLRSLGWAANPANEGDAFGLDFAIEDPSTGLYAIGIECDAPSHALLQRARAREIWRPAVLGRAIPRLHRVSSQGWYHDGDGERARLRQAVEQAMGHADPSSKPLHASTQEASA